MTKVQAQFLVVYLNNENCEESKKLMQTLMKDSFPNTVKSCKWRSSTAPRSHFQFEITQEGKTFEMDLFCLNGSEESLKGSDFLTDDGTHRSLNMELVKGFVVVGSLDDQKERKYKEIREEAKKRIPLFRQDKGLGAKDTNFIVGIQNNVEGLDKDKIVKKVKDHKEWDSSKTVCASNNKELLEGLVKAIQ
ncbi:uncharacterized protein LOC134844228 [Symsagittifera roscoffensis]|uniref:uncharacterized protein LOC134844228 n=1 Tax=Symsagittifera roscoffensis TaxID=84072 RepID=UPI00307B7C52